MPITHYLSRWHAGSCTSKGVKCSTARPCPACLRCRSCCPRSVHESADVASPLTSSTAACSRPPDQTNPQRCDPVCLSLLFLSLFPQDTMHMRHSASLFSCPLPRLLFPAFLSFPLLLLHPGSSRPLCNTTRTTCDHKLADWRSVLLCTAYSRHVADTRHVHGLSARVSCGAGGRPTLHCLGMADHPAWAFLQKTWWHPSGHMGSCRMACPAAQVAALQHRSTLQLCNTWQHTATLASAPCLCGQERATS